MAARSLWQRKQIKPHKMTMAERALAKERPEGQWIQVIHEERS
jgi:hypothetical protein